MKRKLYFKTLFVALFLLLLNFANAQTVSVVTNQPNLNNDAIGSNNGNEPWQYDANQVVLNDTLYGEFQQTTADAETNGEGVYQLCKFDGVNTVTAIPNPDNSPIGVYPNSVKLVFNNKLYFIYVGVVSTDTTQYLASYDGTSITLYPNPDAGLGFVGSLRNFNNTLYVAYSNASGAFQIGKFNGTGITLIPNPDNSTIGFDYDFMNYFDGKIIARYQAASSGAVQLASYDGTSWTLLPNPDATTSYGVLQENAIVYNNDLYWFYASTISNQSYLLQYDGTDNPTLITNPTDETPYGGGVEGFPIVCNDTLFFQYYEGTANSNILAKFGGSSISLVPNPDASTYGFWNVPVVYNNNLYIFYLALDGYHHLAEYEAAGDTLKVYPNPVENTDATGNYWDQPIVYGNNLYFQYYFFSNGNSQLGYFDGTALHLIANPTSPALDYAALPFIFNNVLYFQMEALGYGALGYFNSASLPVSLLNFTAQQQGSRSLLQWQTADETDNDYFEVERSADGKTFTGIGKVAGHGTVTTKEKYQFTDNLPYSGRNYYRLKQFDFNGNYKYSNIETVNFETAEVFKAFPNPAVNSVNLTLPSVAASSMIDVFDMNGKKVMEETISANTISQTLDVSKLAAGVYQMTLIQGTTQQTVKLVKQ
jgi:hypothetical protein